ncbi:MAG: DUF3391 domain-containing protein, partial [Methylobacter sp.]
MLAPYWPITIITMPGLKNQRDIDKIISLGIRYVYIDTSRGLDVPEAPSAEKVHQQLEAKMQRLGKTLKRSVPTQASMHEEIIKARHIFTEASSIVSTVLLDC